MEQIVAGPLPTKIGKDFTWNSDMTRGVQESYDSIIGALYWITPGGWEPMELILAEGNQSWSLKEAILDHTQLSEDPKFEEQGIVSSPAWSPDDRTIAFWASFDAIGIEGHARMDSEFQLMFLDPQTMVYTEMFANIYHPGSIYWSPDGTWLAFTGNYGKIGDEALWLFSPATKALYNIADGRVWSLA